MRIESIEPLGADAAVVIIGCKINLSGEGEVSDIFLGDPDKYLIRLNEFVGENFEPLGERVHAD